MYGNIGNGGLVVELRNSSVFSDFNRLWFMNSDNEFIYYSDGSSHFLCRYNENDLGGTAVLQKQCTNITLHDDRLYYINENDRRVYCCLRDGRSDELVINDTVKEFVIVEKGYIVYVSKSGDIKNCDGVIVAGVNPVRLCATSDKLFFADGSNNFALSCIDLNPVGDSLIHRIENAVPSYINSMGQFIYFTNVLEGNMLFRLDTETETILKICGESAEYPHIIKDNLFFWNGRAWKYLSLEGGMAKEV